MAYFSRKCCGYVPIRIYGFMANIGLLNLLTILNIFLIIVFGACCFLSLYCLIPVFLCLVWVLYINCRCRSNDFGPFFCTKERLGCPGGMTRSRLSCSYEKRVVKGGKADNWQHIFVEKDTNREVYEIHNISFCDVHIIIHILLSDTIDRNSV